MARDEIPKEGSTRIAAPTLRRTAWHEAGHAVVAWDRGFTVTLVSIEPDAESLGRAQHTPAADCAIAAERERANIVAMGGWAGELASGEANDGTTYDSGDLRWMLSHIPEDRIAIELGWAESEAQRIVAANIGRVERLANQLILQRELTDASEILKIIEGQQS